MSIRIGIVSVRDASYHPNRRLLEAIRKAGQEDVLIHPYRLWPEMRKGCLRITGEESCPLPQVLLPRQGAQIGETSLALIRQLQVMGILVVNDADAIAIARNKIYTYQCLTAAGLPCLDTVLVNSEKGFFHAVDRLGGFPVVAKSVSGRQGRDIQRIAGAADAKRRIPLALKPREGLMVQRFLPPENRRDIRILVVGNQCAAAMELVPADGEFRANFHLGSDVRAVEPSPGMRQLAVKATAAVRCTVAGVDLMIDADNRPAIVEVNYSPGFKGLEAASGLDIAGRIVHYAINRFVESSV